LAIRLFKDSEEIKAAVTGSLSIMFGYLADRLTEATAKRTGLYIYVPGLPHSTCMFLRQSVSHASACEE